MTFQNIQNLTREQAAAAAENSVIYKSSLGAREAFYRLWDDEPSVEKLTRARDTIISDIVRCADGFGGEGFTCPPFAIAELDSLARALDGVELALSRFDPHGHHAFRTGAAIAR